VFLDDIVVYARSLAKHDIKLREGFDKIRENRLKLKPEMRIPEERGRLPGACNLRKWSFTETGLDEGNMSIHPRERERT
jgi:hypothetical protein